MTEKIEEPGKTFKLEEIEGKSLIVNLQKIGMLRGALGMETERHESAKRQVLNEIKLLQMNNRTQLEHIKKERKIIGEIEYDPEAGTVTVIKKEVPKSP